MKYKKINENGEPMITGEDVAELVGCGDLYRQGEAEFEKRKSDARKCTEAILQYV
jgi:hypothetical protein